MALVFPLLDLRFLKRGWGNDRLWFTGIEIVPDVFRPLVASKKPFEFNLFSGSISNLCGYYYCLYSDSELAKHSHQTFIVIIE